MGQLLTSRPSKPDSQTIDTTDYSYDPAGHLIGIDVAGGTDKDVTFSIDALGRQASKTVGAEPKTLYAYLGTSAQVSSAALDDCETITLASYSAIDAIGNRISTGVSTGFAYLAVDLHGNVAGAISGGSDPEYLAGFRYDASGQGVDSYTAAGSDVAVPFGYQGRIRQNAPGATDLYDFGARSYDPSLGTFISFDTVTGSAQNPLTLNRYLYALSNPGTMVDPDGHCASYDNWSGCEGGAPASAPAECYYYGSNCPGSGSSGTTTNGGDDSGDSVLVVPGVPEITTVPSQITINHENGAAWEAQVKEAPATLRGQVRNQVQQDDQGRQQEARADRWGEPHS